MNLTSGTWSCSCDLALRSAPALDQVTDEIARRIAQEKDTVVSRAITVRLGTADWTVEAIAPRLSRLCYMDRPEEEWELDGWALLTIWPAELDTVRADAATRLVARIHWKARDC